LSSISINSSIRTYEVFFNDSLDEIFMDKFSEDDMFIIDKQIYIILPHIIKDKLAECRVIQIDAGEELKEYTALSPLINRIIENRLRRNHRLVAVGGGIIQDITGFISSILFRGVEWIFCPTTLLAQADSCIGGKTSINIGHFKNQLGNFYPRQRFSSSQNCCNLCLKEISSLEWGRCSISTLFQEKKISISINGIMSWPSRMIRYFYRWSRGI